MIKLAFYDFCRHIRRNLFVAFLLSVICLLSTSLYSLCCYEYGRYRPFANLHIDAGMFVGDRRGGTINPFQSFEDVMTELDGVAGVYQMYTGKVKTEQGERCDVYLYEDWIWKNWEGRLRSGSWFDDDGEQETVQVILGGAVQGYEAGDVFTVETDAGECSVRVKGILQEGTEILYSNSYSASDMTYNTCYSIPDGERMFLLMRKEGADQNNISSNEIDTWAFVRYRDGLSEEETAALNNQIYHLTGISGRTYSVFQELSGKTLREKILLYIPMIAAGIVLGMVSLFTAAFINMEKGAGYYSICRLTGADKRQCFWISCGNVFGTTAVSALLYVLGSRLIVDYTRKRNIVYTVMSGAGMLAAVLYLLFAGFLALCMYAAMRRNSPLELLRRHRV